MPSLRVLLGALLAGYGALVLLEVVAHDAALAGWLSLALGLLLLLLPLLRPAARRGTPGKARGDAPPTRETSWHRPAVLALGLLCAGGVLAYNALARSRLALPEWAILAYGCALLLAAPSLGRHVAGVPVRTAVAWSFPLLLAPLGLYALNAAVSGTGSALAPVDAKLVVAPTAFGLRLLGTPVDVQGSDMVLATPRGKLVLSVGLVCAGLYPIVLFLGLLGMHALREGVPPRKAARLLALGLAILWVANLVRLMLVAKVGQRWGPQALQTAHANLGWILFALCMVVFWAVALRRAPPSPAAPQPPMVAEGRH